MQISSNLHSNVSRSTRINSSSVHTYIFRLFYLRVILQGFVTQNATGKGQVVLLCHETIRTHMGETVSHDSTLLQDLVFKYQFMVE